MEEEVPAPEPEVVREVTPPAVEDEATPEEITEHIDTAGAEEDDQIGAAPLEDTTSPLIEEPESPMVNREVPPQVMHELEPAGEAPKKSYASIVRHSSPLPTLKGIERNGFLIILFAKRIVLKLYESQILMCFLLNVSLQLRVFETKPRAPAQHAAERTPSAAPSPAVVASPQDSLVESAPVESEGESLY